MRLVAKWGLKATQTACWVLTGHEWSESEFGYPGGGKIDRWCRWCNAHKTQSVFEMTDPKHRLLAKALMDFFKAYGIGVRTDQVLYHGPDDAA